jgi:hypothetical protein
MSNEERMKAKAKRNLAKTRRRISDNRRENSIEERRKLKSEEAGSGAKKKTG